MDTRLDAASTLPGIPGSCPSTASDIRSRQAAMIHSRREREWTL
jgi:hypothetical protein